MHEIQGERKISTQCCPDCFAEGHPFGASYCFRCGAILNPQDKADNDLESGK